MNEPVCRVLHAARIHPRGSSVSASGGASASDSVSVSASADAGGNIADALRELAEAIRDH